MDANEIDDGLKDSSGFSSRHVKTRGGQTASVQSSIGSLSGLQDGRMMESFSAKGSLTLVHVADHLKLTFRHDAALDLIPSIRPQRTLS